MKNLALVILNYLSYEDTVSCVDRLISFNKNFHIIVVDNKSPDDSYEKLVDKYFNRDGIDLILSEENRGYSAGNNLGMKYAIEKYGVDTVAILNPDVIIPGVEVLSVMLERLYSDQSFAVIGGSTISDGEQYNPNTSAWDIPTVKELYRGHSLKKKETPIRIRTLIAPKLAQVDCVVGCFFLAKVKCMQEVGFLDENVFLYNEENILGIRLKRKGYKEILALDQFYYHNHRKHDNSKINFKQKIKSTHNSYLSRKYLCKTYYNSKGLFRLRIAELYNKIYLALAYIKFKIFN